MSDGNILVVDDDHEIADLVEIHLRGEGYHVFKAYNGREALELFDREEVDSQKLLSLYDFVPLFLFAPSQNLSPEFHRQILIHRPLC